MQTREQVIEGLNDIHAVACGLGEDQCYLNSIGIKQLQTLIDDATALLKKQERRIIGRWKQLKGDFTTPGGTPYYVCGACGGSGHLNGCEYPRRKVICDTCGRINLYPWERAYEEGSSLWESDVEDVKQDG